ncbi:MAG: S8 family serine peptidase [Bacteroidota bacterium]
MQTRVIFFVIISTLFFIECSNKEIKKESLIDYNKYWYLKDITLDSVAGISLKKAFDYLDRKQIEDTVVVAVIDSELNIKLDLFKNNIWINVDEVPNNNIDDDNNGYIDDYNGWNFIANTNGKYTKFCHFESTRILRKFNTLLEADIDTASTLGRNYEIYRKAQKDFSFQLQSVKSQEDYGNFLNNNYDKAYATASEFFPNKDYNTKSLDSLYLALKDSNQEKANLIYFVSDCIKYGITKDWIKTYQYNAENILQKCLNLNYDERVNIGDDAYNINDSIYGSPKLFHDISLSYHASQVAAIIADHNRKKFLKIMPIIISSNGDENDKDIATSIRYAVNNGAKVINMSLGKELSLNTKWIIDAVKYAASKDVLIMYAAGNNAKNIENDLNKYYPNDVNEKGEEIVANFISVAASGKTLDENLATNFSNYNKIHVDIFAPGDSIYVYLPDGENYYNQGTSLATPMVSKTAALIRSYYPNLTAAEVKQIIMESGVSFDMMVNKPSTSKEKELVPFSSLSKSGKIVNAYNALLLAEEISKKKKK